MYEHKMALHFAASAAAMALLLSVSEGTLADNPVLAPMEELGKKLFFDKNLSQPRGRQSCASCHDPGVSVTAPNRGVNLTGGVMPGAIPFRFGPRKVPTAITATLITTHFWDGRADGDTVTPRIFPAPWATAMIDHDDDATTDPISLSDAMAAKDSAAVDQAMGPFLNDVEMNLPDALTLCERVASSSYVGLWEDAWGEGIICDDAPAIPAVIDDETGEVSLPALNNAELIHQRIAYAIGVFETTLNTFGSFRDRALAEEILVEGEDDVAFPLRLFNVAQNNGHDWYYDAIEVPNPDRPGRTTPITNNQCAGFCHSSSFRADGTDPEELYAPTRSGFFNIGVPRNPLNPFYLMRFVKDDNGQTINPEGFEFVDLGRGGVTGRDRDMGAHKIPTMRNLFSGGFPRAYMHNGYFKDLKDVVHFYNTRDLWPKCTDRRGQEQKFVTARQAIKRGCWPVAEVPENVFDCGIPGNRTTEDCKVPLADGETIENWCDTRRPTEGIPAHNDLDVGNLCLTEEQENEIVEYLKTLTDEESHPVAHGRAEKRHSGKRNR